MATAIDQRGNGRNGHGGGGDLDGGGGRVLRRRRSLPGGRAVVGGLLVALATLGVFAAYTDATAGPTTRFVVAATDLTLGHRLTAADLRLEAMELPPAAASRAFTSPESLVGATVLATLAPGELVQASHLVRQGDVPAARELSFPVETDLALAGSLVPGERIDVVATFGSGHDAYTVTVVADLPVVGLQQADGSLGGRFTIVTVALARDPDVLALAHAVRAGQVVVVRSTGADRSPAVDGHTDGGAGGDAGNGHAAYRPPPPPEPDEAPR